jgi:L-fucose mutarotase
MRTGSANECCFIENRRKERIVLKLKILHPQILHALGQSGHGSKILIADGNYPFNTGSNPEAEHVYLNLRPGQLGTVDILETIVSAVPIEAAHVMGPDDGSTPPVFADYQRTLNGMELQRIGRHAFYDASRGRDVSLVLASGDQRLYANVLLTIGVVFPA